MPKKAHSLFYLILVIALSLSLLLSSCSSAGPQIPSSTPDKSAPYKLGALLPLSGSSAPFGEELRNAIELAVEEINEGGGVKGRNIEIIYEDDLCDPKTGVTGITKLIEVDGVKVVFGSWCSGVVVAEGPVAESHKVIVMAEGISPKISTAGDYVFRMQTSAPFYTTKASEYLRSSGISKAAILYGNHEYGVAVKDAFEKDFQATGGTIAASEAYDPSTDLRTQLSKIRQAQPEAILVVGYQPETIAAIKQIHELAIPAKILAMPPFETKASIDSLGPLAEGVLYPYHFDENANEKSAQFAETYFERFGKPTSGFAPLLYDGVYIVTNALKQCGEDTACIKDALYKTRHDGIVGTIEFDQNGDPRMPILIKTVKDGKFVKVN